MGTEVMSMEERIKAELANVRKTVGAPAGRSISVKGKVFSLPDGTTNQGPLTCVILDHRNFNRYYTKRYDPNNPAPPDCYAIAKSLDELSPHNHEHVSEPQSDSCADCPLNQWGSDPNGGRGKACRNTVRLAVAAADATPQSEPMTLNVSPTGLTSWTSFVNNLETVGKLPVQAIATVSFDENTAFPKLRFEVADFHDSLDTFWQLREKAQALLDAEPTG